MDLLPVLKKGGLVVVAAPHAARDGMSVLAAKLALRGPLTVLDGGNRFAAYQVARHLRLETVDIASAAGRLFIRRAFTCYQMVTLLESTPSLCQPYLVLDLLATFYDDHVPAHEAGRLLEVCLRQVERLLNTAPVVIALAPPLVPERAFLIERVCERADQVLTYEPPAAAASQPALF